jgi:hypothetical protein
VPDFDLGTDLVVLTVFAAVSLAASVRLLRFRPG